MYKSYKYPIYPNKEQQILLQKHFGCSRFIYNWGLETKIKEYIQNKKSLSFFDLVNKIPNLKKQHPWLCEVCAQSLQTPLRNLDNAFTQFFRRIKKGNREKGFPKFKNKYGKQSCQFPQYTKIVFEKEIISVIKIPNIKAVFHRKFEGKIKTTTISQSKSGKYFVSILVKTGEPIPEKAPITESTSLGIDLGLKDFVTFSNGEKIPNKRFGKKYEKKIAKLNRKMSKQFRMNNKKTTKNREKVRIRLAKIHERITNQRNDFLHKLSTKIIRENQTVCLEDLGVQNMQKNHRLAKSISDVSWSIFVSMLEYKAEWYGKNIIFIGRFEPSSKICNKCGYHNKNLMLKDRKWTCPDCQTLHDRDVNAAINIKNFALHPQNLIREQIPLHERKLTLGENEVCKIHSMNQESVT